MALNDTAIRDDLIAEINAAEAALASDATPSVIRSDMLGAVAKALLPYLSGGDGFDTQDGEERVHFYRTGTNEGQSLSIGIEDAVASWVYQNDEGQGQIRWTVENTDTETNSGESANSATLLLRSDGGGSYLALDGSKFWHEGTFDPATKSDVGHTHDGRYYTEGEVDDLLAGKSDDGHGHAWGEITNKPTSFAPSGHTHPTSEITGSWDSLRFSNKEFTDFANPSAGEVAWDRSEGFRVYTDYKLGSTVAYAWHRIWDETNFDPDTKSDAGHGHNISDVSGLQTALAGKSDEGHTHEESEITDLDKYTKAEVDSLLGGKSDSHSHPYLPLSGGTLTGDILFDEPSEGVYFGSTGNGTVGYIKGNGTEGQVAIGSDNKVQFYETDQDALRIDLNLNDAIYNFLGTLQQGGTDVSLDGHGHNWGEITGKPTSFSPSTHDHPISEVTGLQAALDEKSEEGHYHPISEVTDLQSALDVKSDDGHGHEIGDVSGLQTALDGKSDDGHSHGAGDVTSGTFDLARIPDLPTSKVTSGTFEDARISQSSVTQHQGALSITESQISDFGSYLPTSGGDLTGILKFMDDTYHVDAYQVGQYFYMVPRRDSGGTVVQGPALGYSHSDSKWKIGNHEIYHSGNREKETHTVTSLWTAWDPYNSTGAYMPVAEKDENGYVHLSGRVVPKGTSSMDTPVFTLPPGFRPHDYHHAVAIQMWPNGVRVPAGVYISTDGRVYAMEQHTYSTGFDHPDYVCFDGIVFKQAT